MNFGIPFKRPWGIPFGVPFLGSGTGGSGPSFPVNASKFNGGEQYFNGGSSLNISNDFAFSFWFKKLSAVADPFIGKYIPSGSGRSYYMASALGGDGLYSELSTNGTGITHSLFTGLYPSLNTWHHAVFTRNGTNWTGYLDGVQGATVSVTGSVHASASDFLVSANGSGSRGDYEMAFLDMSLINGLSSSDVLELYRGGEPLCLDGRSATINAKFEHHWDIGNYNANTGSELTDKIGSTDLSNVGSVPFNGTGLTVECV